MPSKIIAKFEIPYWQVLDEKGKYDSKFAPKVSNELLQKMYELMVVSRVFDEKCYSLQRQGKIGTFAPLKGQEATQIGSALALGKGDWVFPSYRENGVHIALGYPMWQLLQFWGGDEAGMKVPENVNSLPVSIPVGSQPLHAVGFSYAFKLRKEKKVAVTYFGDGGTSEGDLNEALNFAGVWNTPTVFLCSNNQYAISVSRKKQSAAQTLAQKAIAGGVEGLQVDGNDILAVYKAVQYALEKARSGKGPTFLECYTYRMSDHTTADDASRYRSQKELKEWEKKDPLSRFKTFLLKKKLWSDAKEKALWEKAHAQVDKDAERYAALPVPNPEDEFDFLYSKIPKELEKQKKEMLEWWNAK